MKQITRSNDDFLRLIIIDKHPEFVVCGIVDEVHEMSMYYDVCHSFMTSM